MLCLGALSAWGGGCGGARVREFLMQHQKLLVLPGVRWLQMVISITRATERVMITQHFHGLCCCVQRSGHRAASRAGETSPVGGASGTPLSPAVHSAPLQQADRCQYESLDA